LIGGESCIDRKGAVSWQGSTSSKRTFSEAFPQGSVLAPILWLIYMADLLEDSPRGTLPFAFADDTTFGIQGCRVTDCEAALQPAADHLHKWCQKWKVSLSHTTSVVSFFSRDPREVNGKVIPKIYFGTTQVPFESTPRLLGVTLDSQLSFGPHTLEVKKKMFSRLNVLRCTAGRSWRQHPASLRALYCTYTQSTALYCTSSWMSALSDNNLMKLEVQHRAGACIITGCTKSTPVSALMREADLLPLADQANIATARLHEKALRHRQDTPIAKAARRWEEIAR